MFNIECPITSSLNNFKNIGYDSHDSIKMIFCCFLLSAN